MNYRLIRINLVRFGRKCDLVMKQSKGKAFNFLQQQIVKILSCLKLDKSNDGESFKVQKKQQQTAQAVLSVK